MSAYDPKRKSALAPKRGSPARSDQYLCQPALRKPDHVEKRDPRSDDNKRRKHTELDNDTRLEKRTYVTS
jgi:hypothetical protein